MEAQGQGDVDTKRSTINPTLKSQENAVPLSDWPDVLRQSGLAPGEVAPLKWKQPSGLDQVPSKTTRVKQLSPRRAYRTTLVAEY